MPLYKIGDSTKPFSSDLATSAIVQLVRDHKRVAVVGGGGVGKSSSSAEAQRRLLSELTLSVPLFGADRYQKLKWEDQSDAIKAELGAYRGDLWIAEGTRVAYALRKGLTVGAVLHLTKLTPNAKGRTTIAAQVKTVLGQFMESNPDIPVFEI